MRVTRNQKYNWVNGVRSVERNVDRPRNLWELETNRIPRPRRAPEEIEAARREREERKEARRNAAEQREAERRRRIMAEREEEIRGFALQIAAVELDAARGHAVQADRIAAESQAAVSEAQVAINNLNTAIRDAELRAAALQQNAEQQIAARPEMHEQACMAVEFPLEGEDVSLLIPSPIGVISYEIDEIDMEMEGEICLIIYLILYDIERQFYKFSVVLKREPKGKPMRKHSTLRAGRRRRHAAHPTDIEYSSIEPPSPNGSLEEISSGSLNLSEEIRSTEDIQAVITAESDAIGVASSSGVQVSADKIQTDHRAIDTAVQTNANGTVVAGPLEVKAIDLSNITNISVLSSGALKTQVSAENNQTDYRVMCIDETSNIQVTAQSKISAIGVASSSELQVSVDNELTAQRDIGTAAATNTNGTAVAGLFEVEAIDLSNIPPVFSSEALDLSATTQEVMELVYGDICGENDKKSKD